MAFSLFFETTLTAQPTEISPILALITAFPFFFDFIFPEEEIHKRLVKGGFSDKNIRNMKIHAGDLLFETGGNNKRYRGIYHVEMISGYICYGFTEKLISGNRCIAFISKIISIFRISSPYKGTAIIIMKPILGITWVNRPIDYYPHMGQMVGRP